MSWNWGSRPSTGLSPAPPTPTPVSSVPVSAPRVEPPEPESYSSSGVSLDLTSPNPVGVYQPREGAGFGGGVVGDVLGVGAGILGQGFKLLSEATQGVDKVIGTGLSGFTGNRAQQSQINVLDQFRKLPDSPEKQEVLAKIAAEAPNDLYKQAQIAFEYLNRTNAYLFPQMQMPVDSTATGLAWNIINQFATPVQAVERTVAGSAGSLNILPFVAGLGTPLRDIGPGGNRLSNILMRIEAGAEVNDTEKWAADQYTSGNWTADQVLDFLSGHGAGYSSDFVTNLMGELVLDPSIGIPIIGEAAKLAGAGRAGRVGSELAAKFGGAGTGTTVDVLRGLQIMADAGDRTANTVLKVGGLIRDTVDPLGAIWGRAPTRLLAPTETARGFQEASGRSTDILENFSGQWSARFHGAIDPGTLGRDFYRGIEQVGAHYGKPGQAIGRAQLDVATGLSNVARRVLIRTWVAQHINPRLEGGITGMLEMAPDEVISRLIKRPPENFADLVDLELGRVAKKNLTYPEMQLLADRMTRAYGMDSAHWLAEMPKWTDGSRSLAHLATYGNETGDLVAAVQRIMATATPETLSKLNFKVRDLYLMNARTLTKDEAARIVRQLGDIESSTLTAEEAQALHEAAVAIAKDAAGKYDKLPRMSLSGTPEENLNELIKLKHYLEDAIERNVLPSEINPREVQALRDIDGGLAELHEMGAQGKAPWKLGVAPDEAAEGGRWGLARDGNGQWHSFYDTWATHVAANATGYLPLAMRVGLTNGKWGVVGRRLADGVDIMENVINTMTRSISSAMVTQNASDRMVALLTSPVGKKARGGGRGSYGFTKEEAEELANALSRTVNETNIPARGMFEGERWDALEKLIPTRLRATREFTPTDLTSVVMRAYQGDFRVVGATQYFTGAIKVKVPKVAIFAERVVPFVRFSASPVFQSQMRVEGTFWNILRGNWAAFGPTPTKYDQEVYLMLERAAGTSVQRSGTDLDAAVEMAQQAMHGQELAQIASDKWGVSWWDKISNAKGAEQLNYLRAIQGDIYSNLEKAARETKFNLNSVIDNLREVHPEATLDQLATHYYYEMLTGRPAIPDVVNPGEKVIGTGMEASVYGPVNMGKLGVIDGDGFLKRAPMFSSNGRRIDNVIDLRRELTAERIRMSEVRQHLDDLNVPKAAAKRFTNYVEFDWNAFWGSVRRQFGLTPEESFQIQNAIAAMAERHGVNPSDFLSQILSPNVSANKVGTAGIGTAPKFITEEGSDAVQYVLGLRGILRSSRETGSTTDDLLNQLADVFIPHLNPSAQEILAEALHTTPEGLARRVAEEAARRTERVIPEPPAPAGAVPDFERQATTAAKRAAAEPQKVSRADPLIKRVLKNAFPDYRGRKVTVEPYSGPKRLTLYWDGGTKDDVVLLNIKGERADVDALGHPMTNPEAFKPFDQPPGTIMVVHSRFQGSDLGIRIYVRQADTPVLPAGAVPEQPRALLGAGDEGVIEGEFTEVAAVAPVQRLAQAWIDLGYGESGMRGSPMLLGNIEPKFIEMGGTHEEFVQLILDADAGKVPGVRPVLGSTASKSSKGKLVIKSADGNPIMSVQVDTPEIARQTAAQRAAARVDEMEAVAEAGVPPPKSPPPEPPPLAPDAERVMREFGSWTHEAIRNGLLKGKQVSPEMTDVLDRIGLLPREYAVPYNFTEAQFKFAALDHLAQKEQDAMGLMYWRRQRSWAERTINHPMFGLYPASYMWGKVAPNFIKFLAKNQFGMRTAAGLSAVRDAQLALAARYEFDPEFQKAVADFGESEALWFVSYLLPGAPWDVGAAAPSWANELLRQADDNATRVANGLDAKPLDMGRILESEANFLSPARGIEAGFDAASEVERGAERVAQDMFRSVFGGSPPLAQPVRATDLTTILEPQVERLQQTLLR